MNDMGGDLTVEEIETTECDVCRGKGTIECMECDGLGETMCSMGYDHTCDRCGGSGEDPCVCQEN